MSSDESSSEDENIKLPDGKPLDKKTAGAADKKVVKKPAAPKKPKSENWEKSKDDDMISPFDIDWGQKVGEGTYGEVYKGTLWGQGVAIKRVKLWNADADVKSTLVEDFHAEIRVLKSLRHPNVVSFLGACYEEPHLCIVCELCDNGSLWDLIKKTRAQKKRFSTRKVLEFGLQMARGLNWLHHKGVMHRDLKPANILVSKHYTLQIADFGLASVKPREKQVDEAYAAGIAGTRFYMAPEVIKSQAYNTKADVFSYAIVLGELISGVAPWETGTARKTAPDVYDQSVVQGYRPALPVNTVPELKLLVTNCWHGDPEQRSAMDEVIDALALIQSNITSAEEDLLEDLPDKVFQMVKEKMARTEELEDQLAQAQSKILKLEEELSNERKRIAASGGQRGPVSGGASATASNPVQQMIPQQQVAISNESPPELSMELAFRHWLQNLCQEEFKEPSLTEALNSGVRLCRAINRIRPNSCKILDPKLSASRIENINSFIKAAKALGVKEADMFAANDLFTNSKGVIATVITSMIAMAMLAMKQQPNLPPCIVAPGLIGNWAGPTFQVQLPVRGWLQKPGSNLQGGYKKRFFVLSKTAKGPRGMFYFDKEVPIDERSGGYMPEDMIRKAVGSFPTEGALIRMYPGGTWPRLQKAFSFSVLPLEKNTSKRLYLLETDSNEDRMRWMHALIFAGAQLDRSPLDKCLPAFRFEAHVEMLVGSSWKMRYIALDPHRKELCVYDDSSKAKKNSLSFAPVRLDENTLIEAVDKGEAGGKEYAFGVTPGFGPPGEFVLGKKNMKYLFGCNDETCQVDYVRLCAEVADPEGLRNPVIVPEAPAPTTLSKKKADGKADGPSTLQKKDASPSTLTKKAEAKPVPKKRAETSSSEEEVKPVAKKASKPVKASVTSDDDDESEPDSNETPKGKPVKKAAAPVKAAASPKAAVGKKKVVDSDDSD